MLSVLVVAKTNKQLPGHVTRGVPMKHCAGHNGLGFVTHSLRAIYE